MLSPLFKRTLRIGNRNEFSITNPLFSASLFTISPRPKSLEKNFSPYKIPKDQLKEKAIVDLEFESLIKSKRLKSFIEKLMLTNTKSSDPQLVPLQGQTYIAKDFDPIDKDKKFVLTVLNSGKTLHLKCSAPGIMPKFNQNPQEICTDTIKIPPNSFGTITLQKEVVFYIDGNESEELKIFSNARLNEVCTVKDLRKLYNIANIMPLDPQTAKLLNLKMQARVYEDSGREQFGEELTLPVLKPTKANSQSATIMLFDPSNKIDGENLTTNSHHHPGSRMLIIVTANKQASVDLNFCGINEAIDTREDLHITENFANNSIYVLTFPSGTHHQFHGDFACISVHPEESMGFIDALNNDNLPGNFLESATVLSKISEGFEASQENLIMKKLEELGVPIENIQKTLKRSELKTINSTKEASNSSSLSSTTASRLDGKSLEQDNSRGSK
jgi:hypothetical protein